ncbi:unnamed protein product [Ambrosiozyma monospora]|uniref:Unnamed protein product n=1 Tax=Ambrosiozyma monospora TaxID=43982 RepID=A0ACB5SU01_AMBMO|nr:unnamed protein product [Ambrosiozyma monospora]
MLFQNSFLIALACSMVVNSAPAPASTGSSGIQVVTNGVSGDSGMTTSYWDCCSPSDVWAASWYPSSVKTGVTGCSAKDKKLTFSSSLKSGCQTGGNTFACSDQHAYAASDSIAYGFAVGKLTEMKSADMACSCFRLTFQSEALSGKQMIVQITNTGTYPDDHHFDLAMPGANTYGEFSSGCQSQFGSSYLWANKVGGVASVDDCDNLPSILQSGCKFRFNWFQGADNQTVSYEQVYCPTALTSISGCVRK